ncbi:MAG: hypothetical protein B6I26_02870 [Desulfobacteraceae bacterium 4572_130]|nr:MAG: hypothetical protein B6I26_02870 [Desulfobacteraceae bacterium 4572_130]
MKTCVSFTGEFIVGIHKSHFTVNNFRENNYISSLGLLPNGTDVNNKINFPDKIIKEYKSDNIIYEVANPFPFRGVTYIHSKWADKNAKNPEKICPYVKKSKSLSFTDNLNKFFKEEKITKKNFKKILKIMPRPLLIALADTSSDTHELLELAKISCSFVFDKNETPIGLCFIKDESNNYLPDIKDHTLFEILANNRYLPDKYKEVMVLRPGIQGTSEILGEWKQPNKKSHIFEYLRENSYIPWGHFAANTANDTVRYRVKELSIYDMKGMRHLYYQRIYTELAKQLDILIPGADKESIKSLSENQLEDIRLKIIKKLLSDNKPELKFNGSLWGWNFGFGYAQSGYRLNASHQQIHQQYAMIPKTIKNSNNQNISTYASGDMIADFVKKYRKNSGKNFFENYLKAIKTNKRIDNNNLKESSLIIFEDKNVICFVPKAQTSQWEIQLIPISKCGNILEADIKMRKSLDKAILIALQTLEAFGAEMITSIEFSKRFDSKNTDQQLLYSFLPKIPDSPTTFSQSQLRWITGHYPEDFAALLRTIVSNSAIKK